jgi:hypothetical protein
MRVIVKLERAMQGKWETGYSDQNKISVRKCPPNYKVPFSNYLGECEFICELEDYTEEDIKEYFSKEDLTAWKEEHDEDEGVHEC